MVTVDSVMPEFILPTGKNKNTAHAKPNANPEETLVHPSCASSSSSVIAAAHIDDIEAALKEFNANKIPQSLGDPQSVSNSSYSPINSPITESYYFPHDIHQATKDAHQPSLPRWTGVARPFSETHADPNLALLTHGKRDFMQIDDYSELPNKRKLVSKSEMDVPFELMEVDIQPC